MIYGSAAHRGGLPELEHLTTDAQALNQVLVPFRITAFQVFQKAASACDHRQQSPAGMMVLTVQFEVVLELQNSLAQDGYLYVWRTGIGVVDSKLCNRLCLRISRQCHARIDTPRLFLIFLYGNRIAHRYRATGVGYFDGLDLFAAKPNLKLRRVLERRGFVITKLPAGGSACPISF
jgi:hypothetical protein